MGGLAGGSVACVPGLGVSTPSEQDTACGDAQACDVGATAAAGDTASDVVEAASDTPIDAQAPPPADEGPPRCGPLTAPEHGSVDIASDGATAVYACASSHLLVGEATRSCDGQGVWAGIAPYCARLCTAPPAPSHGTVDVVDLLATYTCDSGYALTSTGGQHCLDDGSWSGVAPSCVPVDCGAPPRPEHGSVSVTTTTFGAVASFDCDAPWMLLGAVTRRCQADGTWSAEAPKCIEPPGGSLWLGAAPSCTPALDCGTSSCCEARWVPSMTYTRGPALSSDGDATISGFYLDTFEVTVGRFRRYLAAYDAGWRPGVDGAGKGTHAPSGFEWNTDWNGIGSLPGYPADPGPFATWIEADDTLAINYISWYDAYAFCIWDGGRLPSEWEWELAASGGQANRKYPWGDTPDPPASCDYALYFGCTSHLMSIARVGSTTLGAGRWGHYDLAGNVTEWVLDSKDGPNSGPCLDCVFNKVSTFRVIRGGGWNGGASLLVTSNRGASGAAARYSTGGVRCARSL